MRKLVLISLSIFASLTMFAQDGKKCSSAIPMGKDYHAEVQNGQTIWYTASTYDLPLTVTFTPKNNTDPAPEVEMDFTCVPGYYADSILCSLFCKTSGSSGLDMKMPHKPTLNKKTVDGKLVYYLSLGEKYRDLLLRMGISYPVDVFVKVTYKSAGAIELTPDVFANCMDGAKFMQYGDTVRVAANDKERHVIVPYVQWQEDTVLYIWDKNATTPCEMAVANKCDFDPQVVGDNVVQHKVMSPGDTLKTKAEHIYSYVHNTEFPPEAGMYFAKFYSAAPGVMTIVKAKQAPPRGNATLMRYGFTYPLDANSTAVYAIPTSWKVDTKFTTPTSHIFRMKIATDPDFSDAHTLKEYQFQKLEAGHWQGVSGKELKAFWQKTSENFLYIRFECTEATTITPERWAASDCFEDITYLPFAQQSEKQFPVKYKIYLADWVDGDMKLSASVKCRLFVSDTCEFGDTNPSSDWVAYREIKGGAVVTINQETIEGWENSADEDGYIYLYFFGTTTGMVRIESTALEEADPVYQHATLAAKCEGNTVTVSVTAEQDVSVSGTSESWHAVPGTPHELNLPAGTYTIVGEPETIEITLP